MIISASKNCDGCGVKVATKDFIIWHTDRDYKTVRGDDAPTYANYEDATTRVDQHYCRKCWSIIPLSSRTIGHPIISISNCIERTM